MAKGKKKKKRRFQPTESELREVDLIMDRLRVQDPNGESFSNFLHTTKSVLTERRRLAAALLDRLSREGNGVCFQAFCALRDVVSGSQYAKVLRQAEYRFRQRGYTFPEDETQDRQPKQVTLVRREVREVECHYVADPRIGVFHYSAYVPVKGETDFAVVVLLLSPPFQAARLFASFGPRKVYKEFLKETSKRLSGSIKEIPVSCMARVFHDLHRMNRLPSYGMDEFYIAKQALSPYFQEDGSSLFRKCFDSEGPERTSIDVETLVEDIAGPFGAAVVELWNADELKVYAQEMETAQTSVLVVPDHVREQNKLDVLKRAASHLFDPGRREVLARHYEEVSIAFFCNGEQGLAGTYENLARHFREMDDPGESRAACALVDWAMEFHHGIHSGLFRKDPGSEEEESPRTRSGVILVGDSD